MFLSSTDPRRQPGIVTYTIRASCFNPTKDSAVSGVMNDETLEHRGVPVFYALGTTPLTGCELNQVHPRKRHAHYPEVFQNAARRHLYQLDLAAHSQLSIALQRQEPYPPKHIAL